MQMDINWTTVIASSLTAAIVGGTQFIANRYLAKMLDRIDGELKRQRKSDRVKNHS